MSILFYLVLKSLEFLYTLEQIQSATNALIINVLITLTLESIHRFVFILFDPK